MEATIADVFGGEGLKPAAASMSSLYLGVALSQPAAAIPSAETTTIDLNSFMSSPNRTIGHGPPLIPGPGLPYSAAQGISSGDLELRPGVLLDHVGPLLGHHDRGRIGVAGGHRRHDRGIYHPEARDAMHPQPVVDHRHRVAAHLAGADDVVGRLAGMAGRVGAMAVGSE